MQTTRSELAEETIKFFENVAYLTQYAPKKNFQGFEEYFEFHNRTFDEILGSNREKVFYTIKDSIESENDQTDFNDLLFLELRFYNSRFQYAPFPNISIPTWEIKPTEALEGADTVLDSIQDLIDKLPNWLKKLFKIVSEILRLTKGLI